MPKIIGSTVEEHRLTVRSRVFEALTGLLADRPFESITMADLAAAAGIGRTAIYNHFKDRDAVVVQFAADETNRYLDRLLAALDEASSSSERLSLYVRYHLDTAADFHAALVPVLNRTLSVDSMAEIREHVAKVEQVLHDLLRTGIADGSFTIRDLESTVTLIHTCMSTTRVEEDAVVDFVLNAVR